MNYRHAYHAGNFADVVKHVILSRIVEYLKRKDQAFRVIDTHAGIGLYDLRGTEAGKTSEWTGGISRVFDAVEKGEIPAAAIELLQPYLDVVRAVNNGKELRHYPGSPLLTRHLLRKQDRLSALELHPQDAKRLAKLFDGDYQARVIELDGWLSLGAHMPPKEKRGLVLVDPPFEIEGEFDRLVDGLVKAYKRFPGGTYALWYPVKDRKETERFSKRLRETEIPKIMRIELAIRAPSLEPRLDGTGMIVVNPPYTLESEMQTLLPCLTKLLSEEKGSNFSIQWIRSETDRT
ncbi:23S rRNA (adenine(2030)-N(6))-methyltransferase RlmJ [Brucella pseudogrignonensis]|uniref:23S rRNA (adenine(2030)-N(6))-methyltransferase RlmJ n=1 Tax=Brucella pseudogrignonensis TaxID=419475 RepID=UPI000CFB04A2|nr:23S rRNA (adenine(2030)-N(6))-methyltransferase RlmJ [Brucella pseudogrignonensis]MQP41962.1 23S rRNA (adenine(2030)-N(6))-methyltransferase RlmJ [Ochrobactrum sp. MYb237]PQZ43018.1 23S rRNA (adenine(2030)-N(6))-methyltransferase RlmJ [Brucella pseudogrignonensis]PRA36508.1 23S rRNA (adenine(2030)-N(6))-methyltransferase RlmJ [Brucella pseudogrignonensis]PRA61419.1 23S rRNA (adenine(2030)-N(6))-methyltransferase RlmJ [Brucella pseudogrignonensis]